MNYNISKKIIELTDFFKKESYKELLKKSKKLEKENTEIENFHFYHNLIGLTHLKLKNWQTAIYYFNNAIKLDPSYEDSNFNLGLTYYELGNLDDAYDQFLKTLVINKNHKAAKECLIQVLTFFNPGVEKNDIFSLTNNEIKNKTPILDLSKKINDYSIMKLYLDLDKIASKYISDKSYTAQQIFRRNNIDLNCGRHMKIFKKSNIIPEYCFGCFKIVIELDKIIDLIKLVLIFDQAEFLEGIERKCIIEKRSGETFSSGKKNLYKGIIYFSSILELKKVQNKITELLNITIGKTAVISSKRGCTEFSYSYPKYKEIKNNLSEMMKFDPRWKKNEEIFDNQNFIDGKEKKIFKQKTLNKISLNDYLIIHNWIEYAKSINDKSVNIISQIIKKENSDKTA